MVNVIIGLIAPKDLPVKSFLWSLPYKEDDRDDVEEDANAANNEHEDSFHKVLQSGNGYSGFFQVKFVGCSDIEVNRVILCHLVKN